MRKISNLLSNSNLTSREKFLLLVRDDAERIKAGKGLLTPADRNVLEHWQAKDNFEVREWNHLTNAWRHANEMDLEVEFIYQDLRADYLYQVPILLRMLGYPAQRRMGRCIDTLRELNIAALDETIAALSRIHEAETSFFETQSGGETLIAFKDIEIEELFRNRQSQLVEGYAKLLAFEALFKRLEREYETDMTSHVAQRLGLVRGSIEEINEGVCIATGFPNTFTEEERRILRRGEVLRFKEDMIIDIDAIQPNPEAVKDHEETLRKILGNF